ncbi:MAG TPA: hypothetical protein VN039_15405 [Nitrospira sp.]|nr:hypothetical protein [Nitrospira sp.]
MSDALYIIRSGDSTLGEVMTHEEVVRWVGVAISYRLEKTLCLTLQSRALNAAAEAAVHWLSESLAKVPINQETARAFESVLRQHSEVFRQLENK